MNVPRGPLFISFCQSNLNHAEQTEQNVNISISGNVQGNIVVGNANVVGQGAQKSDDIKSRFLVPFPHNPDFVGRDEELSSLHEMLQQKQSIVGIRPTVLVGLGGIGKTQLAVEYAHAHRDDYPSGVFWLNAINPLLIEFSDLAEKLEMSDRDTPRDKAARQAWDYLDAHPDALVIFDNVLEPSELNLPFSPDLVPANLRCRTLFTTRQRDFPRTFQPFEVKVLLEMSAMRLLLRARPEVLNDEHHPEWGWARIVCAYLGWLPLALELAAAYLDAYPEVSITGYLERLRTEGSLETVDESEVRAVDLPTRVEEILKAAAAGNLELKHQVAVSATLQTQWKRLDDDDARLLFRAAGQFPEASWIPIPRLGLLTGIESEAKTGYPSPLNVALKKLYTVSLIEELSEDRLRLHPLVQEFAARLSQPPEPFRVEMAERVAAEFNNLLRLQARVIHYGVDIVLEDLRTVLDFCMDKQGTLTYSHISNLERVLDRQAHYLRDWDSQAQPAFFLQQLRNESFQLDLSELQAHAEIVLTEQRLSHLLCKVRVSHDAPELVRTLIGHSDSVRSVALSADGRLAISASNDGTLKVWNVVAGHELRTLQDDAFRVALSANGRLAISVLKNKTLKVWDVGTGRELRTLQVDSDRVNGIALSTDGKWIVSASGNSTLKVWDVATGRELCILHADVHHIALSADGQRAVFTSGNTLNIWDISDLLNTDAVIDRRLRTLQVPGGSLLGVALSADGQLAISTSEDRTLKVWDLAIGQILHEIEIYDSSIEDVAISADGKFAISATSDHSPSEYYDYIVRPGRLMVWNLATGRELYQLDVCDYDVNSLAISANGQIAISASVNGTLKVWNIATIGRKSYVPLPMDIRIVHVALSADGRYAISDDDSNALTAWNVATGCKLWDERFGRHGAKNMALSTNGRLVISESRNEITILDMVTGHELGTFSCVEKNGSIELIACGQPSVSISRDRTKVWDVETGRELGIFITKRSISTGLLLDDRFSVSTSDVWDAKEGCEVVGYRGVMASRTDGRLSVSTSKNYIKVRDVLTGNVVAELPTRSSLTCCDMTPDGKMIIAGDILGDLHILELIRGGEIQAPDQEEVEACSPRLPRWLKRLLRQQDK